MDKKASRDEAQLLADRNPRRGAFRPVRTSSTSKRFGAIPGVTDRDYYTNSFHIPVYYSISAYNKIRLEAPYHAMTNGGHITYVEAGRRSGEQP